MKFGKCQICHNNISKYKCPKCNITYCSLQCYKSESHIDPEPLENIEQQSPKIDLLPQDQFYYIGINSEVQERLKSPSLQEHLNTVLSILKHPHISKENTIEGRREVAARYLAKLWLGNEEVKEFSDLLSTLLESQEGE